MAFHSLTIAEVRHDTRESIVVGFALPEALKAAFAFVPGQHLILRAAPNGEELRRSYSICSAPDDEHLRIAIKRVPGGVFSTWAHAHFAPGVVVEVMPPSGGFCLAPSPAHAHHYLGIVAGSGITPVFSMLKSVLTREPHSRFTLVYGNRASSTVMLREELADLKDRFLERLSVVHVMSREKQDMDLFNGRIDGDKCRALCRQWLPLADIDAAFLCGPQAMMREVSEALREAGLPASRVHTELFGVAGAPPSSRTARDATAPETGECEVTLIIDGRQQQFTMARTGSSVLDAGLAQGIDIRYACKGGICATCRCKVTEGKVDMDASYALEDYEIARGFVLSCQAYPASERLVLDFDQDG